MIVSSLMHGRHKTVQYCLDMNRKAGFDKFIFAYTTEEDGAFLDRNGVPKIQRENTIIGKAQASLDRCMEYDDHVILMGSDDFINRKTFEIIQSLLPHHDYISFSDIIFKEGKRFYHWTGYQNHRKGEPAGAGKVLRKDLLKELGYQVFIGGNDKGGDFTAHHNIMKKAKSPIQIGVDLGAVLIDVKDKGSQTPLSKFNYLKRII